MATIRMKNRYQRYAWGSPTELPRLLGIDNPTGEPIAEIWMGAHPKSPSELLLESPTGLDTLVREAPVRWLGGVLAEHYDGEFPFLFKLISAAQALSIQAHPDRRQAREGFRREEDEGIPVDAPDRNYRDQNHKPEMLLPLTEFFGLCGFREPEEIRGNLAPLAKSAEIEGKVPLPEADGLERWFREWMGLSEKSKAAILRTAVAEAGKKSRDQASPYWWVAQLNEEYPGDFGGLAPLYLNLLHLEPGEAIFLGPRQLHAYLRGTGVEIMANSDNVLRSGCTVKHVDTEELLRLLQFEPSGPTRISPLSVAAGVDLFRTPAEEFELLRVRSGSLPRRILRKDPLHPPMILLCTEGNPTVSAEGIGGEPLKPGEAVYVTPGRAEVEVQGDGVVYCATVGGGVEL